MASRPKYCIKCGDKRTERPGGICLDCERAENPPERRWGPCTICGETATSKKGTHPACRRTVIDYASEGLPEGDWRFDPFRRVRIWVPKPTPPPKQLGPDAPRCKECGEAFESAVVRQKYCTKWCRERADWARRGAKINQERREQRARARQESAA